ncbi:glycosyltransferase [Neorhizobium sp. JUb45]|uniref:glycosyltransferase n=1 Tax=unclassified Neorhizobium TaxID=2629175 RepID=UPI0010531DE9|nr:glycosyltransferase [Neorhizobium sp. JUb45]TCQ99969.1 glycosyltransferase involved in cell wall biosynthesis [Neorhizobium sp. JUb45]
MSVSHQFAVNGRYLTQSPTGVQRYAHNVLTALDGMLDAEKPVPLLVPEGVADPAFRAMAPKTLSSIFKGHAWEQLKLPQHASGLLLNLCNTAPVFKADQIVCIHDANVFAAPDSYSRSFRMLYKSLQPLIVRGSTRVTTVSHASARQIARYLPIEAQDIVVLPNGHEHVLGWNAEAAVSAPAIVSAIVARSRKYVFALGSSARHKNLTLMFGIAHALDALGVDLVIAGGDAAIFSSVDVARHPNVIMAGRVSDDDLAFFFKHALCLVFPSLNEGFGLPIVEAMALGCPVVSASCSSMVEVCGNAALLACPFDGRQWVEHIAALASSPSLVDDLRERGLRQVTNYSWNSSAEGYRELIERPGPQPVGKKNVMVPEMRIAVAIATRGRPDIVNQTVTHLINTQTVIPRQIIVSCVDMKDAGDLTSDERVTVIAGRAGLCAQRNNAITHLAKDIDLLVFFDDDFVAEPNWLATAAMVFSDESGVVGFTGRVIQDGIKGPGIPFSDAVQALQDPPRHEGARWEMAFSPYGCNMAFRVSAIGDSRFDERLVLYGWLEDRDFGASLAKKGGRLVRCSDTYGVHMGVKSGRMPGDRLGYSQIVNPIYMRGKGTMTTMQMVGQIWRNTSINFARFLAPEPFIDRRGRVKGNLLAVLDVVRGRIQPERASALSQQASKIDPLTKGLAR